MRSFRPGRKTISFAWTLSTLVPLWAGRWQEVIEVIECLTGDQNKWNGVLLVCALWQRLERFTVLLSDKHLSKLKWPIRNNCTQLGEGIRSADTLSWRDDRLHFSSKLEIGVVGGGKGAAIPPLKNGQCEQRLCCLKAQVSLVVEWVRLLTDRSHLFLLTGHLERTSCAKIC